MIDQGRRRGYRNFNVKVSPDPKFDLEMCRVVKRLVPDGFLWADANGGYDGHSPGRRSAPGRCRSGRLRTAHSAQSAQRFAAPRKQKALPIILDEGVVSAVDLEEFIELDMLDGVAMKPARCGGLVEAPREVEILRDAGLMFLGSGLTDPDLSLAASLALFGGYDLQFPAALNGLQFLEGSVLKHPLAVAEGKLAVPDGPGLGVEVDEAKIPMFAVQGQ